MNLAYVITIIFAVFSTVLFAQQDTSALEKEVDEMEIEGLFTFNIEDYRITEREFDCLKREIKNDVVNWSENINDTIADLWVKMPAQDTAVYVYIDLDSSVYKLDVISEYKRRTIGGFGGSFPHASIWSFNVSEDKLVRAIEKLCKQDTSLRAISDLSAMDDRDSYWFHIRIFDANQNEVINMWTREARDDSSSCSLGLFGYSVLNDPYSERKLINRDFWKKENDERIEVFQSRIVDRLKQMVE